MKQAYLIIAHKDDLTFRTLISMLDNENNDIFIHMDKKVKIMMKSQLKRWQKNQLFIIQNDQMLHGGGIVS